MRAKQRYFLFAKSQKYHLSCALPPEAVRGSGQGGGCGVTGSRIPSALARGRGCGLVDTVASLSSPLSIRLDYRFPVEI